MRRSWVGLSILVGLTVSGCGGGSGQKVTSDPTDFSAPLDYSQSQFWLCGANLPPSNDQCLQADLRATTIEPNGSGGEMAGAVVDKPAAANPSFDCFYIYPTVDLSFTPGNHTDFSDVTPMLEPVLGQAAPFRTECRVFAPLYRQVTIGTVTAPATQRDMLLAYAYADVEAAFRYYLAHYNNGRNFVIMGHSQGSWMARQIMQDIIDPDPSLRSRMIAALLIGGDAVTSASDPTQEPQFQNIPACQSDTDTGCVVAYRSYQASNPPPAGVYATALGPLASGQIPICANPASPSAPGTLTAFSGTYLSTISGLQFDVGVGTNLSSAGITVTTPFVVYNGFYSGQCVADADGYPYLAISATGATAGMPDPIDYSSSILAESNAFNLGLHVLDYSFPLQDLLDLVSAKAAALP